MKKCFLLAVVCLSFALGAGVAQAQRPRISDSPNDKTPAPGNKSAVAATPAGPKTAKVKYEGGVFGNTEKVDGTLSTDHMNERLLFWNKQTKREMISIPYINIMAAYGDTQSRRPAAASTVGSSVPYGLGLPALLIKKKYRYLNVQYNDPDTGASGIASFKFDDEATLAAMLQSVADESGLSQRGEIFVRKRTPTPAPDKPDTQFR